jgi:hypothetical protein
MAAPPRALDALRLGGASSPAWDLPLYRVDSRASAASAPVGAPQPRARAAAPSQQQQQQQQQHAPPPDDAAGGGLEARWRAALQREQEVHRELEAERAARQEAELVLADTTQARCTGCAAAWHTLHACRAVRACVGCSVCACGRAERVR